MANTYGVQESVWNVLTPEEKQYVAQGNQTMLSGLGSYYTPPGQTPSSTPSTGVITAPNGTKTSSISTNVPNYPQMPQMYNPANDIQALKQAKIQADKAALDKQRAASLSSLQTEKATIEPAYQKQKIAAGVTAQKQARSFEEYMAQRGGGAAKSGIAAQGVLMNQGAYQNQKGELDTAEANALTSNAQRMTDTETAYNSDIAASEAGANANAMQMQIQANQQAAAQEQAYRQWMYQQQQAQVQNQFSQDMQLAGLTGILPQTYGGGQTMAAQQQALNNKLKEQELAIAWQKANQPKEPTAEDLTTQSYNEIDNLLNSGMSYEQVKSEIARKEASLRRNNLNPSKLYDYLDSALINYYTQRAKALGMPFDASYEL